RRARRCREAEGRAQEPPAGVAGARRCRRDAAAPAHRGGRRRPARQRHRGRGPYRPGYRPWHRPERPQPRRALPAACVRPQGTAMTEGICKPGYERLAETFAQNFAERGEVGASVCLIAGGETVVDLWGGTANPKTQAPWTKDTVSIVFSCT